MFAIIFNRNLHVFPVCEYGYEINLTVEGTGIFFSVKFGTILTAINIQGNKT